MILNEFYYIPRGVAETEIIRCFPCHRFTQHKFLIPYIAVGQKGKVIPVTGRGGA
jgi:hypothetical protein